MIVNVKTDPELLDLLRRASRLPAPDRAELNRQKRSWVIAEMGMGSDADEAAYSSAVTRNDKAELERLDHEAQKRMDFARAFLDGTFA